MLFEGTGKFFLLILLYIIIIVIISRVAMSKLINLAHGKGSAMLIPIYNKYYITNFLNLKTVVFWMSFVPFVNLHYYRIIIEKLLESFGQDSSEAYLYLILPAYKFSFLASKRPKFLNDYDLTNEFVESQKALFTAAPEELPDKISLKKVESVGNSTNSFDQNIAVVDNNDIKDKLNQEQMGLSNNMNINLNNPEVSLNDESNINNVQNTNQDQTVEDAIETNPNNLGEEIPIDGPMPGNSVFTNDSLIPDERHETVVTAVNEEKKQVNPVQEVKKGKFVICPNCGTKLAPGSTTCFMCGHKIN